MEYYSGGRREYRWRTEYRRKLLEQPFSHGFSETHPDSNFDGFCDQPYNPQSDLIDNYPLKISLNNARVTGNTIPSNMVQGKSYPITVTVKNTGTATWDPNYMLGGVGDSTGGCGKIRAVKDSRTDRYDGGAGPELHVLILDDPVGCGNIHTKYQMVQNNWFGQILSEKQVTVTPKKNTGLPWLLLLLHKTNDAAGRKHGTKRITTSSET